MIDIETRGDLLRAFDAFAHDFFRECVERHEAGDSVATRDIRRLNALAERLSVDLTAWLRALAELDGARRQPVSRRDAGRLVIESLFDEALTPAATRLLGAALDLVGEAR